MLCILLCCCNSTRRTDNSILEYQRQIDKLENELRSRDRAIETGIRQLEGITRRSEEMGTDIDSIIGELDSYQQTVERMLQDYREAKGQELNAD
jgi:chromosome segregation ATPase